MKKILLSLLLGLYACISFAQFTWLSKDSFPGSPFTLGAGFGVNGSGYVVGGYNDFGLSVYSNQVWAYGPANDIWTQKSNFPTTVANPSYFTIGNNAYIVGGETSAGTYTSSNYLYNAGSDTWTAKASFPENGVGETFQFVINGIAYVGDGTRNGASSPATTAYSYNPSSDSWSSIAPYPGQPSIDMVSFAIDSFGYAGQGFEGVGAPFNSFYKYNPYTNTWSAVAPFPGPARVGGIAFVINGLAYVGGGWTGSSTGCIVDLSDFYQYDPSTDTWTSVPGITGVARQGSSAFSINNIGYVVSGTSDIYSSLLNNVAEFGTCNDLATAIPPSPPGGTFGIQLYPNPSSQQINIKVNDMAGGEMQYKVFSVDGKLVFSRNSEQSNFVLNTNKLEEAVYILQVSDSRGEQAIQRFEVIH